MKQPKMKNNMGKDFYFQVHQKDDRVENFHCFFYNEDLFFDHYNEIKASGVKNIDFITETQFKLGGTPAQTISIHNDLFKINDAKGAKVGTIAHYELTDKNQTEWIEEAGEITSEQYDYIKNRAK